MSGLSVEKGVSTSKQVVGWFWWVFGMEGDEVGRQRGLLGECSSKLVGGYQVYWRQ